MFKLEGETKKRLCILCCKNSVERQRARIIPQLHCHQDGLVCSLCNRFSCKFCLHSIINKCNESQYKNAIGASKVWLHQVHDFVIDKQDPLAFVGHCCYLRKFRNLDNLKPATNQDSLKSPPDTLSLAGCIYFPEFRLIVDSPISCIDIHGLGEEKMIDPVWHCVLQDEYPRPVRNPNDSSIRHERVILHMGDPHNFNGMKKKYDVYILSVEHDEEHSFDIKLKGTNSPPVSEIMDSLMVTSDLHPERKTSTKVQRVICIFGIRPNKDRSLLVLRFIDMDPRACLGKNHEDNLYHYLFKNMLGTRKQELRRIGGSSGLTNPSTREFTEMMNKPGNVPRRADGTVWIQERLRWKYYYIGVTTGDAVSFEYCQPVKGGAFSIGHWNKNKTKYEFKDSINERGIFHKFPSLLIFCASKPLAALLLDELRKRSGYLCMPQAVNLELKHVHVARNHVAKEPKKNKKNAFYLFYMRFVNFTMVMHPVGFHIDRFENRSPSFLENKTIFIRHDTSGQGRGGGGPTTFTWALLDW
jgi:hypothetical protein